MRRMNQRDLFYSYHCLDESNKSKFFIIFPSTSLSDRCIHFHTILTCGELSIFHDLEDEVEDYLIYSVFPSCFFALNELNYSINFL